MVDITGWTTTTRRGGPRLGVRSRRGGTRLLLVRARALVATAVAVTTITGCSGTSDDTAATTTSTTAAPTTSTTVAPQPPSTVATPAGAAVTQPAQPTEGPGSSALPHQDWEVSEGGTGADAWYVFEPSSPRPATAPLAVVLHGYGEFEGYGTMYELVRHTVLSGSVVVYPRWQTGLTEPCPGPFDIESCMASAVAGIEGALAFLATDPDRVQPDLDRASYFGFSFGGIVTSNLANRWEALDLPEPRAIFLDDPHDGGLDGLGEPALDDTLAGIPATTLFECHVGADGVIAEDPTGGCNAVLPKLDHLPAERRAIVMTTTDDHGQPALSSGHGVCTASEGQADAYDWNFCWKVWDDLRAAADAGELPTAAIGDTAAHTSNGEWSDGTPIAPLTVRPDAPIGP